jgi:hypothetical protein
MYSIFRKLVNGEFVLVRSYAEFEEAKRVVALFNATRSQSFRLLPSYFS